MKTEELGFQALASFQTKLTLADGTALVGGAVVAAGLGYLGSSSSHAESSKRPRKVTPKMIESYRGQIFGFAKDPDDDYMKETYGDDEVLADAIRAGMTPKEAYHLGENLELVPDDPSDPLYAKKIQGLKRMMSNQLTIEWMEHFAGRLEEDDLAKIADLPEIAFEGSDDIFEIKMKGPKGFRRAKGIDWEKTMENIAYLESLPKDVLEDTIPIVNWLDGWVEDEMDNVYKVAALKPFLEKTQSGRALLARIRERYFWGPLPEDLSELLDRSVHLLKEGTFQKFLDAIDKSDQVLEGSELDKKIEEQDLIKGILFLSEHEDELVPWKSYAGFLSAVDKLQAKPTNDDEINSLFDDDVKEDEEDQKELKETGKVTRKDDARFFDRYAQLDPEWAIQSFPYEYERGRRIAPIIRNAVQQIEKMVEDGEHVVVHGRDGEILYTMLTQIPGLDLSRVHYAITSRPLTTMAEGVSGRFMSYLKRSIPKNAIHIDTGFEGSIPRWLDERGFGVKGIRMISATNPAEQFQTTLAPEFIRHIVLRDIEHSPQRLRTPRSFEKMTFSKGAPGYWARYFGVRDALRLPRFTSQGTSKFEKRRYLANLPKTEAPRSMEETPRYRIAEPSPEHDSIEEEIEQTPSSLKMMK